MDITAGNLFFAKQRAAQAGTVTMTAGSIASAGMVLSITDAIQGKDFIHSKKVMVSAFKKIAIATQRIQGKRNAALDLNEEESGVMSIVGTALKTAAYSVLTTVATAVLNGLLWAVSSVVVPVFTFFCTAVGAAVSVLVANPVTAAAVGLAVGAGYLGYKFWQNYKNSTGTDNFEDKGATPAEVAAIEKAYAPTQSAPSTPTVKDSSPSTAPIFQKSGPSAKLAERIAQWRKSLNLAAIEKKNGLPNYTLSALMAQESGGDPKARSLTGAKGLFQFTTIALKDVKQRFGMAVDPDNPEQAAAGAGAYLGWLYQRYNGDMGRTLTAYNAGIGTVGKVDNGTGVYSKENAEYAGRVIGKWLELNPESAEGIPRSSTPSPIPPVPQASGASTSSKSFILPTSGKLSSPFMTEDRTVLGVTRPHGGIDIANAPGTEIYASGDGVVTRSGSASGFGNVIIIDHGNGFETVYGHARKLLVPKGTKVTQGQLIAEMGSEGHSSGPHLHFEIREASVAKDPAGYIKNLGSKGTKLAYAAPPPAAPVTPPPTQMANQDFVNHKGGLVRTAPG